ncbi:MAG: PQQ-binding-like beta-propeller repeat protein [Anaerolineales bacterium]
MKLLWPSLLWVFVLFSCASPYEAHLPVESNFPLKQNQIFSTDEVIKRIAVSDTWMVVYTPGTARIIDLDTKKILWETNLKIQADDPLAFVIVDEVLVATSENQVVLMDKLGYKKTLTLAAPDEDTKDIIRVAAVYPDNIYLNRFPDWDLEAYKISQNAKQWTLSVGRGTTDVFYDEITDVAYIPTRHESFFAVDNTTGEVLWKHDGSTISTTYEDGVIYAVGMGSNSHSIRLSAFDVEKQVELWQSEVTFSQYVYTMTVLNDLVVLSGNEGLLAVNKSDGAMLWQTPKGESFMTKAVEYDGMIYAKGTSYMVYAISHQNGDFVGYLALENNKSFEPEQDLVSGVYRVEDGIVFNTRHAVWLYKK